MRLSVFPLVRIWPPSGGQTIRGLHLTDVSRPKLWSCVTPRLTFMSPNVRQTIDFLIRCAVELGTMRLMISALINMCGGSIRRHIFGKMVDALDAVGVHHEEIMYPEGGHALMKPHAPETDHWCSGAIEFLKGYLG